MNPSLLNKDNCVLVVIDVQEKLLPVIEGADECIKNIIKLIKFARIINIPIVFTEQRNLGNTVSEVLSEIHDPQPVSKITFNCFETEEFCDRLKRLGRDTLIITGVEAHICVIQTALHTIPDYTVHVVDDAVSSRVFRNKEIAMERLRANNVTITSTEIFIYEMLKRAGTDEFRQTLPLVK
ncbi:MAG: isochorismatase family protein [Deltaproteobacteria bacterium]|nr:isochorismatase family protein [Deltaproteobacteria bacterium]